MDEDELRRRFVRLRETERASAPSFAETRERASARRRTRGAFRTRQLVVVAAAAAIVVTVLLSRARSSAPGPTSSITTWRAPTDAFLPTPSGALFGGMPAPGTSVLDTLIPIPSKTGA